MDQKISCHRRYNFGITSEVQKIKQTRIRSVWTASELKKLIEVIDRKSSKGKRDYAIILLACCLGMRCSDIKQLKMDNFHWPERNLVFIQSKTKTSLSLELTPEVGWAVIDYLKYGRPKIDSPCLFVRHLAPFGPFSEDDHLNQLIKGYMQLAHLPTLKKEGACILFVTLWQVCFWRRNPFLLSIYPDQRTRRHFPFSKDHQHSYQKSKENNSGACTSYKQE